MKRVLVVCCVLAVSPAGPPPSARAQPGETGHRDAALALIKSMAAAQDAGAWLAANRSRFSPEVAAAASEIGGEAARRGNTGLAEVAWTVAMVVHDTLGARDRGLQSMLRLQDLKFQQAEKPEAYAAVRNNALQLRAVAERLDRKDLAFEAAVLAADSAYFGLEATRTTPQSKSALVLGALQDLEAALALVQHARSRLALERLVSLASTSLQSATREYHLSQAAIEAAVKRMTPALERAIPADFAFEVPGVGDWRKSVVVAQILAGVSARHGSAAVASARLAMAERRANQEKDVELALALLQDRYEIERQGGTAEQRSRLREQAWRRAQELRTRYRSRAGRLWAGARSDGLYGGMLRDQLSEARTDRTELFAGVEALKARFLLDRIALPRPTELASAEAQTLERKVLAFQKPAEERADLIDGEMRLLSQLFDCAGDLDARAAAVKELEARYAAAGMGFQGTAAPASLAEVQRSLAPKEALLEYVIPYQALHPARDLWMLLVTSSDVKLGHVPLEKVLSSRGGGFTGRMCIDGRAPIDNSPLGQLVLSARVAIQRAEDATAKKHLASLHELLIQPLLAQGVRLEDYDRLVVVPHGPLHYVPFPALVDRAGQHLISKVALAVAPSASVWRTLLARGPGGNRFVALANPVLATRGVPDLPFADQEVRGIVKALQGSGMATTPPPTELAVPRRLVPLPPAAPAARGQLRPLPPEVLGRLKPLKPAEPGALERLELKPAKPVALERLELKPAEPVALERLELKPAEPGVLERLRLPAATDPLVLRREAATKQAFLAEAGNAGILHIATHGDFPDEEALDLHSVWLADQNGKGTALSAADVRAIKLPTPRLVVLSVCNGGLYRFGPSDEPHGLMPAFLEAGARNVLGTLWKLDDQFGRDFMLEFYKHLRSSGPAGAYRKAALHFIAQDDYLRGWSSFALVGTGR